MLQVYSHEHVHIRVVDLLTTRSQFRCMHTWCDPQKGGNLVPSVSTILLV